MTLPRKLPPDRLRALAAHPDINGVIDQPSALPVLHAFAGAAVAESLGVSDPDVLSAIRYHTTARRGMSRLEKIIFVADYIGYDRRFPEAAAVRRAARRSLDEACGHGAGLYAGQAAAKRKNDRAADTGGDRRI